MMKNLIDLYNYISRNDGKFSDWYVGISQNPEHRLFTQHKVSKQSGTWSYTPLTKQKIARAFEQVLIAFGCKGGGGGSDNELLSVYAYKITQYTDEKA